jgi:uncharacterized protein YvpB
MKNKRILSIIVLFAALAAVYFSRKGIDHPVVSNYNSQVPDSVQKDYVLLNVPFTSQAPLGHWEDPRQEDGCEEASLYMAWKWIKNEPITPQEAEKAILEISEFELIHYGNYHDTNAEDTTKLFKEYYNYNKFYIGVNPSIEDIKNALSEGALVLVPANGQRLNNPHYKQPGPTTHMLVIKGFDESAKQFITNDPGTKFGESYKYNYQVVFDSMVDYPTGNHESQEGRPKSMIVIQK